MNQKIEKLNLTKIEKEINAVLPFIEEMLYQILSDKPDIIIFLDKGSRFFFTPIAKQIRELSRVQKQNYTPKIIAWNNDSFKSTEIVSVNEATDRIVELLTQIETHNSKIIFIDETIDRACFAKVIDSLNQESNLEASYFAFSQTRNFNHSYFSHFKNISNFHVSDLKVDYALFSKEISKTIISDHTNNTGTVESIPNKNSSKSDKDLLHKARSFINSKLSELRIHNYFKSRYNPK